MFINKSGEGLNNVCGKRFVTDIEIIAFAKIFDVSFDELLKQTEQ